MKIRSSHAVEKLEQLLLLRVLSGEFADRDTLPSRKELVREYGVCHVTVGAAMGRLVARGLCLSRTGYGMVPVPLIHAVDHKLLLELIRQADDLAHAMTVLEQLLMLVHKILGDAAAVAASKRDDSHVAAFAEVLPSQVVGLDEPEPTDAKPFEEYNVWRIIAGASENIGTTAMLNALRPLWFEPDVMRGARFCVPRLEVAGLVGAVVDQAPEKARLIAGQVLDSRTAAVRKALMAARTTLPTPESSTQIN
jgi:DNA-binding FadR family transcriptional regulator